jgi:hypothetical protein
MSVPPDSRTNMRFLTCALLSLLPLAACASKSGTSASPEKTAGTFASPEEAVQALVDSATDRSRAEELLGPGGFEVLKSGDEVEDHDDIEAVRKLIREKVAFDPKDGDRRVALLGNDEWPLPLPIVRCEGNRWRFDVDAGKDEILNRRIGRNELCTIDTLRAIVDAQMEYASEGRDGKQPCFACKWASSDGKHDGLYWEAGDKEPESPLGPLVAAAAAKGYDKPDDGDPDPYHGYYYRLLTEQGANAPGGARNYIVDGQLRAGFAVIAWPATWGNSGIMTLMINQRGIVYQRDLGENTVKLAQEIKAFDPDAPWTPTAN